MAGAGGAPGLPPPEALRGWWWEDAFVPQQLGYQDGKPNRLWGSLRVEGKEAKVS